MRRAAPRMISGRGRRFAERAARTSHRVACSALKHTHEKVGDHWEPKQQPGPSDEQAEGGEGTDRHTAGGVDANASKAHSRSRRYRDGYLDITSSAEPRSRQRLPAWTELLGAHGACADRVRVELDRVLRVLRVLERCLCGAHRPREAHHRCDDHEGEGGEDR